MGLMEIFSQGDAVSKTVAIVLLLMSIASWVVIIWKSWLMLRAKKSTLAAIANFWAAPDIAAARTAALAADQEQLVVPLIDAAQAPASGTMAAAGDKGQQVTRQLRDALHKRLAKLQYGQVLLATVGSISPFVGLLGTVWGIYEALVGLTGGGQVSLDRVAGPVGEALVMTAAGLAVAIPAVLAYNVFGKWIGQIEAELEGFARDLRELVTH